MSFKNLKNKNNLETLTKAVESLNSNNFEDGDKYWKCEVDKAGNGSAVIRFLPTNEDKDKDNLPWVRIWNHGFQDKGGWLIDNCPTTLGNPCPVCEENGKLWNSGIEANKKLVSEKRKRRLVYNSNIYIVNDPKHPENNGTVKLFKYGKKIFDKLQEAMKPQFEDEVAFDPFDLYTGANFKLKIRKVDGYQNYDKCEFESNSPLLDDDSELEKIYNSEYSLQELIDPKNFKSYSDLKKRYDKVLGVESEPVRTTSETNHVDTKSLGNIETDDDDDDLNYFKKLAYDDDV